MSDDAITLTVELTRGSGTDDRDKLKAKVSGETVSEATRKLQEVKAELRQQAEDLREIQPQQRPRVADGQQTLEGDEADA